MNSLGKLRLLGASAVIAAGFAMQPAVAQSTSDDGRGNAVVVPYYTVNEGWRTLVNLTNTTENSLAVKFRMHEARNSRDVLDFNLALSPNDVWSAYIEADANGRPVLRTEDRSCTIPLAVRDNGGVASELAYSNSFNDHTATDGVVERMSEGYIEILVMGETVGNGGVDSIAYAAEHVAGEPRDCAKVQTAFTRRSAQWVPGNNPIPGVDGAVATGSGSPLARLDSTRDDGTDASVVGYGPIVSSNALRVNATLYNRAEGYAGGVESLHVKDWGVGENLVTAQQFPWFLEPTIASADGLWSTTGLVAVVGGISSTQVLNEWTNNPATGAQADWVLTFPTKRFNVDVDYDNIQAACNQWRNGGTAGGAIDAVSACPAAAFPPINSFQSLDNGVAPIEVVYDIFDREEGGVRVTLDEVTVSPAPPPEVIIDNLNYEVNVMKVGRNAAALPSALNSKIAASIDTSLLVSGDSQGWLKVTFGDEITPDNVPVTGLLFKLRNFGAGNNQNFGQATSHAYTR